MASRFDDHALNSRLTLNNLGGMGPSSGSSTNKYRDMPWIVYEGIMVLDGRSVDLIISDVSGGNKYYMDNIQEEYLVRKSRAVDNYKTNGTAFVLKYNGKFRPDVISIGSLATGEYNFKFSFVDSEQSNLTRQVPVTVPYLPMTFFDLDGNDDLSESYEMASTWDAEGVEYVQGTKVDHGCKQIPGDKHFCYANSAREEIKIPDNFNELSDDTKKAAATFLFKDKSHFTINYKLNYPHRVFLFKGSCALTTTATTTTTTTTSTGSHQVGVDGDGDTDVNKYCGGSMASRFDDHALNSRLTLNNLGGMGPSSGGSTYKYGDMPWIVYEGIMVVDGRSVDLIISDVSGGNKYYMDNTDEQLSTVVAKVYSSGESDWRDGTAFALKYNGRFRPDVISIGSLATGEYKFNFSFVDSEQSDLRRQVPVTVPYLPMTFFDLDGKTTSLGESFEVASTWDAEGVEYVQGTKVDHGCKQMPGDKQFCYANSAREEIKIPPNFNELSVDTKKAAATFLFKDKSHFTINYKLNHPHRVFLFKGSCVL